MLKSKGNKQKINMQINLQPNQDTKRKGRNAYTKINMFLHK